MKIGKDLRLCRWVARCRSTSLFQLIKAIVGVAGRGLWQAPNAVHFFLEKLNNNVPASNQPTRLPWTSSSQFILHHFFLNFDMRTSLTLTPNSITSHPWPNTAIWLILSRKNNRIIWSTQIYVDWSAATSGQNEIRTFLAPKAQTPCCSLFQ